MSRSSQENYDKNLEYTKNACVDFPLLKDTSCVSPRYITCPKYMVSELVAYTLSTNPKKIIVTITDD